MGLRPWSSLFQTPVWFYGSARGSLHAHILNALI